MAIHAEELRRYLAEATGRPVSLRMNSNTHSMVTARPDHPGPGIKVSLHRMFLEADEAVLRALALFIHKPTPEARQIIRDYIASNDKLIQASRAESTLPRRLTGSAKGKVYQLEERAIQLNEDYFQNRLEFRIIWGREIRTGRRQRNITLGTWNTHQRTIRIHPILDQEVVPNYFLDFIIFHEMCHNAVPSIRSESGRNHHHTRDFYLLERCYRYHAIAKQWETKSLGGLIRDWNRG